MTCDEFKALNNPVPATSAERTACAIHFSECGVCCQMIRERTLKLLSSTTGVPVTGIILQALLNLLSDLSDPENAKMVAERFGDKRK